jgi:hypothetical protein
MSDALDLVYRTIDEEHRDKSASTRRQMVAGVAATLGGMGLLGAVPGVARATPPSLDPNGLVRIEDQDPQTILNVAATAEVLATIVNTVGSVGANAADGRFVGPVSLPRDGTTKISASAGQELQHYNVLIALGARPATRRIWVPDAVFASSDGLLSTLEVGDQIFVNAYLIATTVFGNAGQGNLARAAAEFMGVEAVHRAFARDLRGVPGNDRIFVRFEQTETAVGAPNRGTSGFRDVRTAVSQLRAAGFGFGEEGARPGRFYDFGTVSRRTPSPDFLVNPSPR